MGTLTFVRVMLVFKRLIRWFRLYNVSEFTVEEVVRKRIEFVTKHIVPPSNLKEILRVLSSDFFEPMLSKLPLWPSDKVVMRHLLTWNYKTTKAYEHFDDLLCDKNRLALFSLHPRNVSPQFPYLSTDSQANHACRSLALESSSSDTPSKLSDREEQRLAAYSLRHIHERATGGYFPHPRLCLTPTRADMCPPEARVGGYRTPPGRGASGYNPESVQSVDSDSSLKISSTTATDLENPHNPKTSLEEEFRPLEVKMLKIPLPNMMMAYITATKPNGAKQSMTPCFVIEDMEPRMRARGGNTQTQLRRSANQETSEDSGRGSPKLMPQTSLSGKSAAAAAVVKQPARTAAGPRTLKKTGVPKRKGTGSTESLPDKRPRRCSASTAGVADSSPLPVDNFPPVTPFKSVIQKVPSKVIVATTADFPDPLRAAEGVEHDFVDYELSTMFDDVYERGDLLDSRSLLEVEGNPSNFQKVQPGHGPPPTHHLMPPGPGPSSSPLASSGGDASPMFRDSNPQMSGPLLNNTQADVEPPTPAQQGNLGVKRMESQQGFYQGVDTLDFLSISNDDYLNSLEDPSFNNQKKKSEESHSLCNEMSDDGRSNARSGKQVDKPGRRVVVATAKKSTPSLPITTASLLEHLSTPLTTSTSTIRDSPHFPTPTARDSPHLSTPLTTSTPTARTSPRVRGTHAPTLTPVKKNKAASSTRSSVSRENSVEPTPSPSTKDPDKSTEWIYSSASQSVIDQLMNHAPPGAHEKLVEYIKNATKSRVSEDKHQSTNSAEESSSPRTISVGPNPKKTGTRNNVPPASPSPPIVPAPVKRKRGRPAKNTPSVLNHVVEHSTKRTAPPAKQKEYNEDSDVSERGARKQRRRRKKNGEDSTAATNRRTKDEFLDGLSKKLNGTLYDDSESGVEDEEYEGEAQNLPILKQACEKLTENITKKA